MKPNPLTSIDRVNELLSYDQETGTFTWKVDRNWNSKAGSMAGSLRRDGYISLKIDGERMLAHRIAWLIVNGTDPLVIDHADGNRSNNSIRNLRDGTHSENCGNAKKHKAAKNPFKCVQWREKDSKWQARICVRGRRRSLGHFTTAEAAAAAYKAAALAEFGEYARFSTPDPEHADQIAA